MFSSLDSFLTRIAAEGDLWYLPNPGNAGDALIGAATWQRFDRLGLRVHAIPRDGFDPTGKIVLFGGGGNLVPLYSQAADFLRANHGKARRLVLLPHTVDGHEDLLASLGPSTTIFCREEVSLRHCRIHASRAEVVLSHDLALGLEVDRLLLPSSMDLARLHLQGAWTTLRRGRVDGPGLSEIRHAWSWAKRLGPLAVGKEGPRHDSRLDAFRIDSESGGHPRSPGNLDLSDLLELRSYRRHAMDISASWLLGCLRGHTLVRTDRLHVCIAASLLGIAVEFHPNSYFKCQAIWEHSLQGLFPTIRWRG